MSKQNNRSIPEFEGYSPIEMHNLLHFTFEPDSPISIQKLTKEEYLNIPILNQVKYFLNLVRESGEIKLTSKGFLPTKIVHEIYNEGFIEEYQFSSGISKLYKESDSLTINLTRLLVELAGLTKKRNGKLSLTKAGGKIASDNQKLFELVFKTMTQKFSWAYYDNYEDEQLGQLGYGFSLLLISKYGMQKRLDSFYAEKYLKAFPQFLESITPTYGTVENYAGNCYSIRMFERFLCYFGLVKIEKKGKILDREIFITKTELFDKLIKVRPHNKN
ncbi:hypothetical protein DWB61_06150 [Ancylomarina euxinus]|uniref:Uncharacterized protein n=1 Tax=Ancylomarina euxinus TaxID=2283627 RepID=A0A425Y494_9BACT|nr:hypothetical protein [Ancylomarina euxinus]MCZ4694618.1 hypothetical protein [Ancylomarina euxinus]MUP14161.1 hypothetical protein [Ancylomarina euxinus]RRG23017.1 hypothetical protein DWB61_06150 [Ancylomarina euxinus]